MPKKRYPTDELLRIANRAYSKRHSLVYVAECLSRYTGWTFTQSCVWLDRHVKVKK